MGSQPAPAQSPTDGQIAQVKLNVNNLIAFNNHLHDYLQDPTNEVFLKLGESPKDRGQKFLTTLLDASLFALGDIPIPGASILFTFLGTFYGAYSENTPPSLSDSFGDVWARLSATFLQANDDLSQIYEEPAANWNRSYTDSTTGITVTVSQLGDPGVRMPGVDEPLFNQATDTVVASYRYNLTKQTIGESWKIHPDQSGQNEGNDVNKIAGLIQSYSAKHPAYFLTQASNTNHQGEVTSWQVYYHFLGATSGSKQAPDDMCQWLFQDVQGEDSLARPNSVAIHADVFEDPVLNETGWGLEGSLKSFRPPF